MCTSVCVCVSVWGKGQRDRQTDTKLVRLTDRQTGRQAGRQTNRQAHRHTD